MVWKLKRKVLCRVTSVINVQIMNTLWNTVAPEYGGGFEIWRMLVPGMPAKNTSILASPKSSFDGAVKDGN